MSQGRGKGWEEKIQHKVFKTYLKNIGIKEESIKTEVAINTSLFENNLRYSRPDFIILHKNSIELVECKKGNSLSYSLAQAIGELLIYKTLIELGYHIEGVSNNTLSNKKIRLSICAVDGYKYGNSGDKWTAHHTKLLKQIEKYLGEKITIYLIKPIDKTKSTEEYWDKEEFHTIEILEH